MEARKTFHIGQSIAVVIPPKIKDFLEIKGRDILVFRITKENLLLLEKLDPSRHPKLFSLIPKQFNNEV